MEKITITTQENTSNPVQMVNIQPEIITPRTRTIPLEQYVAQLTNQQTNLQAQLDKVTAQLQEVTDAGGDVQVIVAKLQAKTVVQTKIVK